MTPELMQQKRKLKSFTKRLKERVLSKEKIAETLKNALEECLDFSGVSIALLDPVHYEIKLKSASTPYWAISDREKEWVIKRTKELLISNPNHEPLEFLYIPNRRKFLYTDLEQFKQDVKHYDYGCEDALYLVLISEDELILGLVHVQDWAKKQPISETFFNDIQGDVLDLIKAAVLALDNLFIHQKIESLISDKNQLKERIQKDEEDLKRRVLELTALYEMSNALGYSLNYTQIVNLVMETLYKVLHFDVGSIFLLDFVPGGEIITRVNVPVDTEFIGMVQTNVVSACSPFLKQQIPIDRVKMTTGYHTKGQAQSSKKAVMKSFANIPLIFKEEILGMLNVCSSKESAFARNEMTFLHTMANQLASHLGRLKMVKKLEKSKIGSLVKCMAEGVIMFDENRDLAIINPPALVLLGFKSSVKVTTDELEDKFKEMGIYGMIQKCVQEGVNLLDYEVVYEEKVLLLNLTKVMDGENHKIGTVLVLRDSTEVHRLNRVKTQRLEVISRLNMILKSIGDLNNLLIVILEFILSISGTEMGAIQVKKQKEFVTQVHSNFPDKVFRSYRFRNEEVIADYVIQSKEMVFISDYHKSPLVHPYAKIILEDYLCLPIMVKNDLIGVLHLAKKVGDVGPRITEDDVNTISTIAPLIGTAIHNAMLYQQTLEKQKMDQELKVANEIQTKLLPEKLPSVGAVSFGAISMPARMIGGDYYDFIELGDGSCGVVVADIVGKGVPAGLFMAMLKSILHTHLMGVTSPKEALRKVNSLLYRDPVINKFVPLFYGVLDPTGSEFRYSNAGHEPAQLYSEGQFHSLDTPGFPLGSMSDGEYEEGSVRLKEGDWILLFTDGLIEARSEKGDQFDLEGLRALLKKQEALPPDQFVDSTKAFLMDNLYLVKQHDDLTLVAMKAISGSQRDHLIRFKKLSVTSSKKDVRLVRQVVDELVTEMGFDESDAFNIKLAVNEAQSNVIEHAYGGREDGDIVLKFFVYKDRLEILIKDFGPGIRKKTIKSREEHLDQLEGSGLGLFLINTYMDKVEYHPSKWGTELLLVKNLNKGEQHANSKTETV